MDIIKAVKKLGNKLTGETYTSKDLVKLIDEIADDYSGGSGGALVVHATYSEGIHTLDKTYSEIKSAFSSGVVVIEETYTVDGIETTLNDIVVYVQEFAATLEDPAFYAIYTGSSRQYQASSTSSYPEFQEG